MLAWNEYVQIIGGRPIRAAISHWRVGQLKPGESEDVMPPKDT